MFNNLSVILHVDID